MCLSEEAFGKHMSSVSPKEMVCRQQSQSSEGAKREAAGSQFTGQTGGAQESEGSRKEGFQGKAAGALSGGSECIFTVL